MSAPSRAQVIADLGHLLENFQGREYSGALGPETRLFADLGLVSIDALILVERLQDHYGRSLPLGPLIAEVGRRTDRDLSLGELAALLHRHLAAP